MDEKSTWTPTWHIRFHGLQEFSSCPPPIGGPDANFGRPYFCNIFQYGIFHSRFQNKFHDIQTPPSSSLILVEFETYYIKPNSPLFFRQQYMQWSRNMVHSHFTLCLRVCDHLKRLSQHLWYALWMREPRVLRLLTITRSRLLSEVALKPVVVRSKVFYNNYKINPSHLYYSPTIFRLLKFCNFGPNLIRSTWKQTQLTQLHMSASYIDFLLYIF